MKIYFLLIIHVKLTKMQLMQYEKRGRRGIDREEDEIKREEGNKGTGLKKKDEKVLT